VSAQGCCFIRVDAVVDDDHLQRILRRHARRANRLERESCRMVVDQHERTTRRHQRPATAAPTESIDQR